MKIPKAIQRGDNWRICVNYKSNRYTSTHDTEKEAKEWAARKILELKDASKSSKDEIPKHTYLEAIEYYLKNVTPKKKGARWETLRFRKLIRDNPQLVSKNLLDLKSFDFVKYRDSRIKEVTPTTVSREMELLSAVLYCCIRELGWLAASPMTLVARPKLPPPRNRRAYDHEINTILDACSYSEDSPVKTKSQEVGWSVMFALETAMRLGEITSMTWDNVYIDKMYVHLPDTKNGLTRNIPLSEKAEQLLLQIKGVNNPRVLSIESDSLSTLFRKYRNRCEIDDLRFHDLRHEATTRMAQIIQNPADLSKITGHTDINILVNTYYNPTPTEVAQRLRKGGLK